MLGSSLRLCFWQLPVAVDLVQETLIELVAFWLGQLLRVVLGVKDVTRPGSSPPLGQHRCKQIIARIVISCLSDIRTYVGSSLDME